jgi:hypothetical protein
MKFKHLALVASALSLAATANAQSITSFENLDFDSGVVNQGGGFNGFDNPSHDIAGWRNLNDAAALVDSGVEGQGAWWGPYEDKSAFMRFGDGAYNLSDYTIQAGDLFSISFFAKSWDNPSVAEWTATLFYDTPANVIGSYTTGTSLTGTWTQYSTPTPIAATGASEGGKLGVIFLNSGAANFANLDEIQINVVPEPSAISLMAMAGLGMLLRRRQLVK